MSVFMNPWLRRSTAALAAGSVLALGACNAPSGRTQLLTAGGAGVGAAIGAQQGGVEGALVGALAGALVGSMVGAALDEIERQNFQAAQLAAARSGGASSRSFVNSKNQRVRYEARTVRTYTQDGTRYRDLSYSISRDGGAAQSGTATAKEVRSSSGSTSWVVE